MDYGAALEMRFGATRRGFESRPLRHLRTARQRRQVLAFKLDEAGGEGIPARLELPC